jgi:integrase
MKRDLPKHVYVNRSRHGQERIYFAKGGRAPFIRIYEAPNTPEFFERYAALLLKGTAKVGLKKASSVVLESGPKPKPETFRWLCVQYYKSVDCHLRREKPILDACCKEPIAPNDKRTFGAMPLEALDLKAVKVLRDRKAKAGMIGSAANRVKALRRLCKWARGEGHLLVNPALELEFIRRKTDGHPPWTDEEIKKFRDHWPIGTMQRLAFELMLGCGLAKVDAIAGGPKNVEEFKGQKLLHYRRSKTGVHGHPPMPKELLDAIAAVNLKSTTHFLLTSYGKPFTSSASFGNWFADACELAKVEKTPHGLRKKCAVGYAERGCTASQLCSIMAWSSIKEAEVYTRAASRRKMAAMAGGLRVE